MLENRLFSEGLHVLGRQPDAEQSERYLDAYFGDELTALEKRVVASTTFEHAEDISRAAGQAEDGEEKQSDSPELAAIKKQLDKQFDIPTAYSEKLSEAITIKSLLQRNNEELDVGLVSRVERRLGPTGCRGRFAPRRTGRFTDGKEYTRVRSVSHAI